jgi:hypothetical protein
MSEHVKNVYVRERNFTYRVRPIGQTDFSRFEALVRKRESLLKLIYERRKGEGLGEPEPTRA